MKKREFLGNFTYIRGSFLNYKQAWILPDVNAFSLLLTVF